MFQFIGYDFYSDGNALNNAPSAVSNIINTKLTNGTLLTKRIKENTLITFTKEGKVFVNEAYLCDLDYNKMVLFMLLLENKL